MKTTLTVLAVLTLSPSFTSGVEPGKADRGRQLMFIVRVLEGDPLGSRENGSIKVLAEPTLVTLENRSFQMMVGGDIPVPGEDGQARSVETGLKLEGKPGTVKNGKLQLDLSITNARVVNQTEDRLEVQTTGKRMISTIRLGKVTRFWLSQPDAPAGQLQWVELTPEIVTSLIPE